VTVFAISLPFDSSFCCEELHLPRSVQLGVRIAADITRFARCGRAVWVVGWEEAESTVAERAKEGLMPPLRRRPLKGAEMVGGAGHAPAPAADAASEGNRIDALTKLKALYDSGVLTREQYDSEHARLTAGI
jgi:hypothetical protein